MLHYAIAEHLATGPESIRGKPGNKSGIASNGATWDGARTRRRLHNKIAYAALEDVKAFKNHKKGVITRCFDVESVELKVISGDGAQWIQKNHPENSLSLLDAYHRNRAIGRLVKNPELAGALRGPLYAGEIASLLEHLKTALEETRDEQEKRSGGTARLLYREQRRPDRIL